MCMSQFFKNYNDLKLKELHLVEKNGLFRLVFQMEIDTLSRVVNVYETY